MSIAETVYTYGVIKKSVCVFGGGGVSSTAAMGAELISRPENANKSVI